jgi:hypothetical protein
LNPHEEVQKRASNSKYLIYMKWFESGQYTLNIEPTWRSSKEAVMSRNLINMKRLRRGLEHCKGGIIIKRFRRRTTHS